VDGQPHLHVFTSVNGIPHRSEGPDLADRTPAVAVTWVNPPEQGVWLEAVVADDAGTWYGYYHNERAGVECGDTGKVTPRIGAARSSDRGVTWEDLGPILEAPPETSVPLGRGTTPKASPTRCGAVGSLHTYLNRYVMLLNRASDVHFTQEGIYVSLSESLDQPGRWSAPRLILPGGSWYPQVVGLEPGDTDKTAGRVARLFLHGTSSYLLEFQR